MTTPSPLVQKILDIVLEEHAPDVTSYDAGWIDDCECGHFVSLWGFDVDGDQRWAQYREHLGQKLQEMLDEPGALDA